ncbi:hypothetical protein A2U01_0065623, partial [Trifolium medium]|nr:hypothetical protein [Trifolium medium]
RGKNKEVIGAAEKVSVAETVVGDEWVAGVESDWVIGAAEMSVCSSFLSRREIYNGKVKRKGK